MTQTICPVCREEAEGGHAVGDSSVFICPRCGGYRLAGTAMALLEAGTLQQPDPVWFRGLVKRKGDKTTEYPLITSADLGR